MLSFHRCIASTADHVGDTYLNNLTLRKLQKEKLVEARRLIRETLRAAYKAATAAFVGEERPISPNFFTQGSWGYGTLNRPAFIPPQQADMDDGCFLPMTFVRGANPKRAADWYFSIADAALGRLVKDQGWQGYDKSKPTCCRVIIDDESHVDIPLYAIRDERFVLMKSMGQERAGRVLVESALAEDELPFDWSVVTDEDVLLALRNGRWNPSNPMDVSAWVEMVVAAHGEGEQLRATWRAIKAWRDQQFPKGDGPSSILLMALVTLDFEPIAGGHDQTLLQAAKSIQARIIGRVEAPWDRHAVREDLNRLTGEQREVVRARAKLLQEELEASMLGDIDEAPSLLKRLRVQLGRHFSSDTTLVREVRPAQVVSSYPAAAASIPNLRGDNRSA